jgi:putative chitinase
VRTVPPAVLKALSPSLKDPVSVAIALSAACTEFGIVEQHHLAHFLGQTCHESGGWRVFVENLNYGSEALCRVWPSRFTPALAKQYARQPQKIACKVYASRMGNGDEASGDGWTYRGRGYIQLTGKANYEVAAKALGIPLDKLPAYLETPEGAARSAALFWRDRGLNGVADRGGVAAVTKAINGGNNGLQDRRYLTEQALRLLTVQ